ncbi:hypothetical protein A7Q09_09670 [Methylacidiphilum sp. Yel]|nr:hypothetical protein A7Q09_09670 [Methylacidiphilum sp. Yel]
MSFFQKYWIVFFYTYFLVFSSLAFTNNQEINKKSTPMGVTSKEEETGYVTENKKELFKVQRLRSAAIQKRGICPSNLWVYGKFEAQSSPHDGLIVCLIAGDKTKRIASSSGMAVGAGIIFWPLIGVPAFFSSKHLDHVILVVHSSCPPIKKNSILYISPEAPARVLVNMKTDAGYHLMELEMIFPPQILSQE